MFDEPFIGATDLAGRCEPFRGAVVEFHSIFNLSEWKSYVNTKSKIEDKVNNLFDLKRKGYQPREHEMLVEWDGKINSMLLIQQLMKYRYDISQTAKKSQQKTLQKTSNVYEGKAEERSEYIPSNQTKAQPASSYLKDIGYNAQLMANQMLQAQASQYVPKSQPVEEKPKFESNPKHKLKPKKKEDNEEVQFVKKTTVQAPAKAVNASDLEKELIAYKAAQKPAVAVNVEDLEKQQMSSSSQKEITKAINVEDIEKQAIKAPAKALNVEDLEKQALKESVKAINVEELENSLSKDVAPKGIEVDQIEKELLNEQAKELTQK